MARMTGADIAASIDDTGAQVLGGDWVLEYRVGTIESAALAAEAYGWTLAAPSLAATAGVIAVGENTGGAVGSGITVSGTGADLLRATASVTAGKGALAFEAAPAGVTIVSGSGSASFVFEGTAADLQAALPALRYSYVGSSEIGDSDILALSVTNQTTGGTATLASGRAITVQPQNDAPTVVPPAFPGGTGLLTVAEGGNIDFAAPGAPGGIGTSQVNLGLIDADNTTRQVIIKITAGPTAGVLTLNGLEVAVGQTLAASDIAGLRYVHGSSQVLAVTQDSFRINVDDGAGGLVTDVVIPIALTPVNDAPSAGGTVTLIEGETGVPFRDGVLPAPLGGGRGGLSITDPDQAGGVPFTVDITSLPSRGVLRYDGVVVIAGQTLSGFDATRLTYDHDGSETTDDSFTIRVTDDGGGAGVASRLTSPDQTISLSIIPNNDDPTLPVNTGVVLGNGEALAGPEVILTRAMLQAADVDTPDDRLTYTLIGLPANGYLISTDFLGTFLPVGFAFKQSELDAGKIRFIATSTGPFVTDFDFTLTDSSVRLWPAPQREGGLYANETTTTLEQRSFHIESKGLPPGGGGPAQPGTPADVNAAPAVVGTLVLGRDRIAEGEDIALTAAELGATDADNTPAELVYRINTLPQNGQLLLDGVPLTVAASFTQADVDAGRISYRHDGREVFGGSFDFTLSDGERAVGPRTFTFDVRPQNDTPTASAPAGGLKVAEGGSVATGLGVGDGDNATPTDRTTDYAEDNTLSLEVVVLPDPLIGQLRIGADAVTAGQLLSTADLALLRYHHLGVERYTDSFKVRPVDDRGVAAAGTPAGNPTNQPSAGALLTVNITVQPVNDAPAFAGKREGVLREGESITIQGATGYTGGLGGVTGSGTPSLPATGAFLSYSDSDNATDQRQYRITTAPANGTVRLDGQVLGAGSVFTQADLDARRITYVHNGSESEADFFDYVVSDGDWRANETRAFMQTEVPDPGRFNFTISGTNDAPAIAGPAGPVRIDSTVAANNPVAGFVVSDIDLTDAVGPAEVDFVQVTLRLLDSTGAPIGDYATGFAGGGVSIAIAAGSGATVTRSGPDDIVQFQGSRDQVNAALAGLTVTFANDCDAIYRLQVIVDDRVRNAAGTLDPSDLDANGGELNQGRSDLDGFAATAVPGTVFDWLTAAVPDNDPNITARTVELWASSVNDPAIFTAPAAATVNEDVRTRVSGSFVVSDAESAAFGTPVTVTLTVPAGNGGTLGIGAAAASTSLTPSGGQAVAISGDNTLSITLTGRAIDIQALLNGRNVADTANDAAGGLFYTTAPDVNHDLNDAVDGDVTLTGTFSESTSAIGGDIGVGSVANPAIPGSVALTITAVNDAPAVSLASAGLVVSGTAAITVSGATVTDVDASDGYAAGETDGTVQVLVRLLQADATPLPTAAYASAGAGLDVTLDTTAVGHGATVDGVLDGVGAPVEVRGTLAQVNAWLAGLRLTFANLANSNVDQAYSIEVVADDRLRDGAGALAGAANGGATNQQTGLPAVPPTDDFDAFATTVSAYNVYNVVRATRSVFVSSINDPGSISANNVVVAEASATLVLDATNANITIADPDDNGDANLTATVTLPADSGLVFSEVGGGGVGGGGGSVLGTGTAQLTLTGNEAQLNARLQALTVAFPDPAGDARAEDWNGSFTVTVVYNDAGNTGTRPAEIPGIPGDTGDPAADPGDFDYAGGAGAALVTTRTFQVTVTAVNDAPLRATGLVAIPLISVEEDAPGGVGSNPPGAIVLDLFGPAYTDPRDQVNQAVTGGSVADAFAGIAITGNAAIGAQGAWQYSSDGSNWTALPVVSETSALQLQSGDRLRFVPAADFHGTPGALTARLVDASGLALVTGSIVDVSDEFSGGNTRYSDSLNTVTHTVTVLPVNDRPTAAGTALTATFEDNTDPTGAALTTLGFGYGDAIDNRTSIAGGGNTATALGGYAIVGNAANAAGEGRWQYSTGGAWTDVGTVSDAAAVVLPTSASLRFLPAADFNGTPGALSLRLADSVQAAATGVNLSGSVGPTGTWSLPVTLATSVDPRNDAPVLSGTVNATFTEGSPAAALLSGAAASDIDLPGVVTFGGGRITVTLDTWRAGDVLSLAGSPAGVAGTSGGSGASLVLQLDTAATPATIGTILNALRFENTSNDPVGHLLGIDDFDRAYTVVLNDGNNVNGAANAGGNGGGDPTLDSNVLAGVITLVPVNDPPVATDDANTLTETTASVSGNVKTGTGGTLDTDPDHLNAELSVDAIRTGGVEGAGTEGVVGGVPLAGRYGTLAISASGNYTYTLDAANPQVKALSSGETLQDRFNYRIADPDGGRDTALLVITITGVDDGGPSIAAVDGNGAAAGEATVFESGLTTDGPAGESRTVSGAISVSAPSGLASVTVGGTSFTVAQLAAFSVDSPSAIIDTGEGELRLTGLSVTAGAAVAPTAATLSYVYTLKAAIGHGGATADESLDSVALVATDATSAAASASGTLAVRIVDDVPTARADIAAVVAGTIASALQTSGNVVAAVAAGDTSDRLGADTVAAPVTALSANGTAGVPGVALAGRYGQLEMDASGAYVYRASQANPAVAALGPGRTLVDTFDYTVTDADGDSSTATLTITVRGEALPPPLTGGADRPVQGERRDPFFATDPRRPVNMQMEPSLHVQRAVRETAAGTLEHARLIQGLALPPGSELHSESLSIADGMDPTEHVSRDGVRYSRQLLADSQERPGSLGNALVIGNQSLFDPFSPFGTREVIGQSTETTPVAAFAAGDAQPGNPAAQPADEAGPAMARDDGGTPPLLAAAPLASAAPVAAWAGFTQQLRQVALERALVREGQASPGPLRAAQLPAIAAQDGVRTLARAG
jgi:VCBS repeat-containing protein